MARPEPFPLRWNRNGALKRDEIGMNRHRALGYCLSMIFSENRFALFPDHALDSCFDALSLREPVSASLENAPDVETGLARHP